MSKQNSLDMRYGRQGGRIVPWRAPSVPTVRLPEQLEPEPEPEQMSLLDGDDGS